MPTMTHEAPKVKASRKARPFACRLASAVIEINGTLYQAEPIDAGEDGTAAYRLAKEDGQVYDVIRRHDGRITCDCPHYTVRIEGLSADLCKHGKAAVELGLIAAPRPVSTNGR